MSNQREREYPNSGILFKNDRKQGEKDRDYRGDGEVTCPVCESRIALWLSGWIRTGRKGKFLGLSFKPKDRADAISTEPAARSEQERDRDIPF